MSFFSIVVITSFYFILQPKVSLPIYSPSMVSEELVEEDIRYVKKYHSISNFSLTNQNGELINQEFYQNKIYIADFFFTTCPDICTKMTENMGYLQNELKNQTDVLLVSFSVTPNIDSVSVLRAYADLKGVDDSKWNLFTGSKKDIYELARKSFLVAKNDGDGGKYDMIHTENFVLIDKENRIRGFYDGTNEVEMNKLLKDVKILQNSYLD
ncbi:SCO family protein [Flavobacteriaceae bacterium]|jgi:protein SCO1/2|nr:SCO family protein [Flavobacteriaceae bacterium]MDA9213339.1 SCO family protein [Flavobacteriaceae bacterium]MDA9373429.1 SCO family protein [Flavobacteriaceae bacterium]MDA9827075.1 SCO family protein [Flavobacteriaceae bacterium]MDB4005733.1 SCO family protein [Flavobacteriaceae bacterium]